MLHGLSHPRIARAVSLGMITAYVRIAFSLDDFPEKNKESIIRHVVIHGNEKAMEAVKSASNLSPILCVLREPDLEQKIDVLLALKRTVEIIFELKIPRENRQNDINK